MRRPLFALIMVLVALTASSAAGAIPDYRRLVGKDAQAAGLSRMIGQLWGYAKAMGIKLNGIRGASDMRAFGVLVPAAYQEGLVRGQQLATDKRQGTKAEKEQLEGFMKGYSLALRRVSKRLIPGDKGHWCAHPGSPAAETIISIRPKKRKASDAYTQGYQLGKSAAVLAAYDRQFGQQTLLYELGEMLVKGGGYSRLFDPSLSRPLPKKAPAQQTVVQRQKQKTGPHGEILGDLNRRNGGDI